MAITTMTEKKIICIQVCAGTDKDYWSCNWADFNIDLSANSLFIQSDTGNYCHTWVNFQPSNNNPNKFPIFLSNMDEQYLLSKLTKPCQFDWEATRNRIIPIAAPKAAEALRQCEQGFTDEYDFGCWYMNQEDSHSDDLEAIVMDYTPGEHALARMFCQEVRPKLIEYIQQQQKEKGD